MATKDSTSTPTNSTQATAPSNVVSLFSGKRRRAPEASGSNLVAKLQRLLAMAESGELAGGYFVLNFRDENPKTMVAGNIPPMPGVLSSSMQ